MFGHQNDTDSNQDNTNMVPDELVADASLASEGSTPATPTPTASAVPAAVSTPVVIAEPSSAPTLSDSLTDSLTPLVAALDKPSTDTPSLSTPRVDDSGELLSLKQQALQQLSPLIDHLDQTPEEKFRTTMMMIQANDDQGLIQNAYEAAQAITDEKVRAQALLDVVNEINYFTQQNKQTS